MIHVSILVLNQAILSSIDAPRQLFNRVNSFLKNDGKPPAFEVQLVGLTWETRLNEGSCTMHSDRLLRNVRKTDLVVVPMVCGDLDQAVKLNMGFVPWIRRQYRINAEIASLCSGTFFLASTGLLNDKTCSIHWAAANDFRRMFPSIKTASQKIITYEKGIYTSAGSYSYLNLLLCLVERYVDRQTSILVSKMFEIEIERTSQAPFMIFAGQKEHGDEAILSAQEFIENNYQDKITIDQLTKLFALSKRNLQRRFKKATATTVMEYLQRVKIEAVKKGLEIGDKTISDLMFDVGYSDNKAFRSTFKKFTGLTPYAYRSRYNNQIVTQEA